MPCFRWKVGRIWPDEGVVKYPSREQALKELCELYPGEQIELTEIPEAEADRVVEGPGDWIK